MNQLLKYPGGKWRIADWIISHFPEHRVYVEAFFGSGAVFFRKPPAYLNTVNDVYGEIVNLFRVCREFPEKLATAVNLTPFSREEFVNCYDRNVDDPVERARRTIVRYHQSFGTSNSSKNSWKNTQTAGGPRCATMWNYLPDTVTEVCQRLKEAQIENIDAIQLIERYNAPDALIYCDPPYMPKLRKANIYASEMNEQDHERLLRALKRSKSMIVISGYDCELYNDMLPDWSTDEIETTAQMGKPRVEKIWCNFEYSGEQMKLL